MTMHGLGNLEKGERFISTNDYISKILSHAISPKRWITTINSYKLVDKLAIYQSPASSFFSSHTLGAFEIHCYSSIPKLQETKSMAVSKSLTATASLVPHTNSSMTTVRVGSFCGGWTPNVLMTCDDTLSKLACS
jgi:hypothetical protein